MPSVSCTQRFLSPIPGGAACAFSIDLPGAALDKVAARHTHGGSVAKLPVYGNAIRFPSRYKEKFLIDMDAAK
jgi:hypothetical protein